MKHTYRYSVEGWDEVPTEFESTFPDTCGDSLAEEAAEDLWNDGDQDPGDWPMTLEIFTVDNRSLGKYKVFLDFSPDFTARQEA